MNIKHELLVNHPRSTEDNASLTERCPSVRKCVAKLLLAALAEHVGLRPPFHFYTILQDPCHGGETLVTLSETPTHFKTVATWWRLRPPAPRALLAEVFDGLPELHIQVLGQVGERRRAVQLSAVGFCWQSVTSNLQARYVHMIFPVGSGNLEWYREHVSKIDASTEAQSTSCSSDAQGKCTGISMIPPKEKRKPASNPKHCPLT
mmetsp:Transcript_72950/g.169118  ORF Transcript_72950/g.169118 Transcript_72950/m.169118 type:complete len:205 (+) Transcript_72950:411-1025(+)